MENSLVVAGQYKIVAEAKKLDRMHKKLEGLNEQFKLEEYAFKHALMQAMKDNSIKRIDNDNATFTYTFQTTKTNVDTEQMKRTTLYELLQQLQSMDEEQLKEWKVYDLFTNVSAVEENLRIKYKGNV